MQPQLPKPASGVSRITEHLFSPECKKNKADKLIFLFFTFFLFSATTFAQWSAVSASAPNNNNGVMLLLSDGTVMCKSDAGGGDGVGNTWNLLTPNNGSYSGGSWTTLATMAKTRLYFVSQVLQDGRVYIAGGEYGTGGNFMEIYNPLTNSW